MQSTEVPIGRDRAESRKKTQIFCQEKPRKGEKREVISESS